MLNWIMKNLKCTTNKEDLKEILNNIYEYCLLDINTYKVDTLYDEYYKKYRMLNELKFVDENFYFINKKDIESFEDELNYSYRNKRNKLLL